MLLSQAIRKGIEQRPQSFTGFFVKTVDINHTSATRSCALGAAYEGLTGESENVITDIEIIVARHITYFSSMYESQITVGKNTQHYSDRASLILETLEKHFPVLLITSLYPCDCTKLKSQLLRIILHLNDNHKWTREQIADWVETVENEA